MINDKADEVLKKLFQSFLSRYQIKLQTSIKGCEFVFECVQLQYYKYRKINSNCGGSCIDSPSWIKTKNPTKQ